MSYVYPEAAALQRKPKVGDGDCVALVREFTCLRTRPTSSWRQGAPVLNNKGFKPGTAIATFVKGRYQLHRWHRHAALDCWALGDLVHPCQQCRLGGEAFG